MRRAAALAITAVLVAAAPAAAGPDDVAADVSRKVMSPYCPGVTLHDCPSAAADKLRLDIARWAERGMSENDIMARLESEFGPDIRAAPTPSGPGLLAWLLPIVAIAAGAMVAWALARTYASRRSPPAEPAGAAINPEERRRLHDELTALRSER